MCAGMASRQRTFNFSLAQEKWLWNGANGATRSPVLRAGKSIATASNFIIVEMFQFTNYGDVVTSNEHLFPLRRTTDLISKKHPMESVTTRPLNLLQYIFLDLFLCVLPKCVQHLTKTKMYVCTR